MSQFRRADPYKLPRKPRTFAKKEFIDPDFPDEPFDVSVHSIDGVELTLAIERAEAMAAEFVQQEIDLEDENPKYYFLKGEPTRVSKRLLQNIFFLLQMQVEVPVEERYDFDTWLAIAKKMPVAWAAIMNWGTQFVPKVPAQGNLTGGVPTGSSDSSPKTANGTQNSKSGKTSLRSEPTISSGG